MPPLNSPRRRALRAVLSALAGGGLTAAGLAGPLAGGALAEGVPTTTAATSTAATPAPVGSTPASGTAQPSSTTTTTTTTTTSTTPAPTTTVVPPAQTSTPQPSTPASVAEVPTVVLQRRQKASASAPASASQTVTKAKKGSSASQGANATTNVAASPETIAAAGALAAILASNNASAQALSFYRIPLFLLPIYKAAAVQYGVPWQILAAINEVETNYGSDLSVSTAGAVGWMQFMPSTWLEYGVDALNAGYADPYNPVDAVFAAARYLRAAGAATNLRAAILAYNHSEEYVDSVLLRAKLISSYPKSVIATLTGLTDGRLPVTGTEVSWRELGSASSATAGAQAVTASSGSSTPATAGSPAVAPSAAGAQAGTTPASAKLVEVKSAADAQVVAVEDGRVVEIGHSAKLGHYLVLRDVNGDLFTYSHLGSIAKTYAPERASKSSTKSAVIEAASTRARTPSQPASAGSQSPVTLQVKSPVIHTAGGSGQVSLPTSSQEALPAGMGKVRLFAHPGNPDARAAASSSASPRASSSRAPGRLSLKKGSVVASGTVLGHVAVSSGDHSGHLRFAIRPAGDRAAIEPGPILASWAQLEAALHPAGATATNALLGATASDVFLLSKAQLERTVLSDPAITIYACGRQDIASGAVDKRVLGVLAFLSRSGLKPTVSGLRCGQSAYTASGSRSAESLGDGVAISAINGVAIAGNQGPGTITDLTVRTLLTLPSEFLPHQITSLMRYPGATRTRALAADWNKIQLEFTPASATGTAHAAKASAPSSTSSLSAAQWDQLITRVGALQTPAVATKPSSSAVPDAKHG